MPVPFFFFICSLFALSLPLLTWRNRRVARRAQRLAHEEGSLWSGLAAALFDASTAPPFERIEIALAAILRKLDLRYAALTLHAHGEARVLAAVNAGEEIALERGTMVPRRSIFCGSLAGDAKLLAIDYASLSEWRRHPASTDRGWETYIGVNCGPAEGGALVLSFFDFTPRVALFSPAEKLLVEQLAPWVAAMARAPLADPSLDGVSGMASGAEINGSAILAAPGPAMRKDS